MNQWGYNKPGGWHKTTPSV